MYGVALPSPVSVSGIHFLPTEMDFQRFCKRRKLYREPSVSPVTLADDDDDDNVMAENRGDSLMSRQLLPPDELNREADYKYKARFLFSMGLEPVLPDRRRRECFIYNTYCPERIDSDPIPN